jgi:type VI secretion system protein ImpJ
MTTHAVHWHEGMFLRPHHFQTARRHGTEAAGRGDKWAQHYNWGLRAVELDLDALANYRGVVRVLHARLRDGTPVAVPEDGALAPVDLRGAFERSGPVTLYLAVPVLHLGRANVAAEGDGESARYLLDTLELEDENTGASAQTVQVRRLNARLLLSTQEPAGYDLLPLARMEKSSRAEAVPQLDETYIPPLLACDAWQPLAAGVLQNLYDRVGKKIELLASQVVSRGITFDSNAQGDAALLGQLRALNEVSAVLGVLAHAQGVHPLTAYLELCRAVGQLAVFGDARRAPELPRYDHDDLGGCFFRLKQYLDGLLNVLVEPEWRERPFIGAGLRLQVALEPAWLEATWRMYIGVQGKLDAEECVRLLTKPGQLDMKVGSSDRVDALFRMGQAGLRFAHAPRPPRALPSVPGLAYFEVNRDPAGGEWQYVQRSLTLALRLNENLITGNIQGQRVLTIKTGGHTTTLQFTLYLVPQGG